VGISVLSSEPQPWAQLFGLRGWTLRASQLRASNLLLNQGPSDCCYAKGHSLATYVLSSEKPAGKPFVGKRSAHLPGHILLQQPTTPGRRQSLRLSAKLPNMLTRGPSIFSNPSRLNHSYQCTSQHDSFLLTSVGRSQVVQATTKKTLFYFSVFQFRCTRFNSILLHDSFVSVDCSNSNGYSIQLFVANFWHTSDEISQGFKIMPGMWLLCVLWLNRILTPQPEMLA